MNPEIFFAESNSSNGLQLDHTFLFICTLRDLKTSYTVCQLVKPIIKKLHTDDKYFTHPVVSKTTVLDDLTGLGANLDGGRGEAERYCFLRLAVDLEID